MVPAQIALMVKNTRSPKCPKNNHPKTPEGPRTTPWPPQGPQPLPAGQSSLHLRRLLQQPPLLSPLSLLLVEELLQQPVPRPLPPRQTASDHGLVSPPEGHLFRRGRRDRRPSRLHLHPHRLFLLRQREQPLLAVSLVPRHKPISTGEPSPPPVHPHRCEDEALNDLVPRGGGRRGRTCAHRADGASRQ